MAGKDSANKTNSSNYKVFFLPSCQCQDFFDYIIKEKVAPENRRKTVIYYKIEYEIESFYLKASIKNLLYSIWMVQNAEA